MMGWERKKANNLFFALGLTGRIEDGIKDEIKTQASCTMTVASECVAHKVAELLVRTFLYVLWVVYTRSIPGR